MTGPGRRPAVAGSFYPGEPARLEALVDALLRRVPARLRRTAAAEGAAPPARPLGLLVPHAGLVYSGGTAAAGWSAIEGEEPLTVVLLGTNHSAGWLSGVGAWAEGPWQLPGREVAVDEALVAAVVGLGGPFLDDPDAHRREHSIEVQLPVLAAVAPAARIVPLAVACGTGSRALVAGERLGMLLAERRAAGDPVVLAISTDMAHYPDAQACAAVTRRLLPAITGLRPESLAAGEAALRHEAVPGLACGMCGIEPAVLGLAALRAMGARLGTELAATTSADAGGPPDRTVGYLAVRFDA